MASSSVPRQGDQQGGEDDHNDDSPKVVDVSRSSWAKAATSAALRLSKKAAVAGAVVASAPIVIPPYCIVSTVGLALAVPFGLYLGSIAATEKLMSSLLSSTTTTSSHSLVDDELFEVLEGSVLEEEEAVSVVSVYESAVGDNIAPDDVEEDGYVEAGDLVAKAKIIENCFDDEKSWAKASIEHEILALKNIVGYKAGVCTSIVEELRALYLVTGVEPPVSLKVPTDTEEINNNLKLLKLLIGVK